MKHVLQHINLKNLILEPFDLATGSILVRPKK